jgi:hypothetical protein
MLTREQNSLGGKRGSREDKQRSGRLGGKLAGNIAVQTGQINQFISAGGKASSQVQRTCPHCGHSGRSNSMFKSHFDRCKKRVH